MYNKRTSRQLLVFLVILILCSSPIGGILASDNVGESTDLTADDIVALFPEAFKDGRINDNSFCPFSADKEIIHTYFRTIDGIVYELNTYSNGTYDLLVEYPAQVIANNRATTDYGQMFSYYYPIVDGIAQMTAYARYTYNSSTGVNIITSCIGGGSDVVLYGWGVYSGVGEVWGNAVSEGYEFIGLNIDLTPKSGSRGLNKSTYTSDPY